MEVYDVTLLLNRELVSKAKLCMVSVFPDIVKDKKSSKNFHKKFRECGPLIPRFNHKQIQTIYQ